tara:strand:- start:481 stop:1644 length:1164 start_codon:yes stop_codon:yes gene_type:complete
MRKAKLNTIFLGFLVFDLLLLPRFLLSTPISFFIMIPLVTMIGRISAREALAYTGMVTIFISSVMYGIEKSGSLEVENIKRAVQLSLIMGLVLIDYGSVNYLKLTSILRKVLCLFYLICGAFLLLMLSNQDLYESVVVSIYPESKTMISENLASLRYSFHFTDPNSLGYLVVMCFVLACLINYTARVKSIIFCVSLTLIISTQSRGALLAFFFVSVVYWAQYLDFKAKLNSVLLLLLVFGIFISVFFEYVDFYWELYEKRQRLEEVSGKGIGGGRLDVWYYFFSNFNPNPFFGVGYYLEREGVMFRPHSDFIRMQLSYGTLIFFVFLLFFNGLDRKLLMLWAAFFVPFMINTIIDDYRLFGVFVAFYFILKWEGRVSKPSYNLFVRK